jgi:hypothetical protein
MERPRRLRPQPSLRPPSAPHLEVLLAALLVKPGVQSADLAAPAADQLGIRVVLPEALTEVPTEEQTVEAMAAATEVSSQMARLLSPTLQRLLTAQFPSTERPAVRMAAVTEGRVVVAGPAMSVPISSFPRSTQPRSRLSTSLLHLRSQDRVRMLDVQAQSRRLLPSLLPPRRSPSTAPSLPAFPCTTVPVEHMFLFH